MRMTIVSFLFTVSCWATTTVNIARPFAARAGVPNSITLTATVTGPAGSVAWTHISGPATATFGTASALSTTYTAPLPTDLVTGDYVVRATYTNSDGVTSRTIHVGSVAVDSRGIVTSGMGARFDRLLGPLLISGASPWPYFDKGYYPTADIIATTALANPPSLGSAFTGTVQVTSAPAFLLGTGTQFTTDFVWDQGCGGGNTQILIAWNSVDGVATGRYFDTIANVTDNTHAQLCNYQNQIDLGSGLSFYRMPSASTYFQPYWWGVGGGAGTNSWNYYDLGLALYRLFFSTGLTIYQTQAWQVVDYWWQWQLDHGRKSDLPRTMSMQSQYLRALDGKPERFPDLKKLVDYFNGGFIGFPSSLLGRFFDAREAGYATWDFALGAMADPDSTRHASYCSMLSSRIPAWNTWQQPEGFWSEDLYSYNASYVYKTPGSSPWRTDIPIHSLQAGYDVMNDTTATGCNNQALAAITLPTIIKATEWTYRQGRSDPALGGNGGVYYDAGYETAGQAPFAVSGTVSVLLGSTAVVGIGTSFVSNFGSSGTKYIGFSSTQTIYKVVASADPTHATISPAFGSYGELANISGGGYAGVPKASTSCASQAKYCWDNGYWPSFPPNGDRNLSRLMVGVVSWLYSTTGLPIYRVWGDQWFSNAFGGPDAGPGQAGPHTGPGSDGIETDWVAAVPSCAIDPTVACSGASYSPSNVAQALGKNFNQGVGAPSAAEWLAVRLTVFGHPTGVQGRKAYMGGKVIVH